MRLDFLIKGDWKRQLEQSIRISDIAKEHPGVLAGLKLNEKDMADIDRLYPISVTRHYASLIDWDNPKDPLLKLVIPGKAELRLSGLPDQSGESMNTNSTGIRGLQHKYGPTALVLATGHCASYCRFCFRRRFVGTKREVLADVDRAVSYINEHPEISNVLISGGDSMMLSNKDIDRLLRLLREIRHVKTVRFGTRMPVYLPDRFMDRDLLDILKAHNSGKSIAIVSHVDHPKELSPESVAAHRSLLDSGIVVLTQSVLLRGVNDKAFVLRDLFRSIAAMGVRPYYLFQCRPVRGATHFSVPLLEGSQIVEKAKAQLSGVEKTFRFIMSHVSGKIEVVHVAKTDTDRIAILKYHQARDPKYIGEPIVLAYGRQAYWLDDILGQDGHMVIQGSDVAGYAREQSNALARA